MSSEPVSSQPTKECYRCGHLMAADAQKCSECGRRQYRICFCGHRVDIAQTECPECGVTWAPSRRSRAKRRSAKVKLQALFKGALVGAASALALMGLFQILLRYFARLGSDSGGLPPDMAGQAALAVMGMRNVLSFWLQAASSRSDALLGVAVGVAIGAGVGVVIYLARMGLLKMNRQKTRGSSHRGRRRRA